MDQLLVHVRTEGLNGICNIDTRVLQSKLLTGHEQLDSSGVGMMKCIVGLQQNLKFVESKIDRMKQEWDKFYRPYTMNMDILKKKYGPDTNDTNVVTNDILHFVRGTAKLEQNNLIEFLLKELANTKILQRLDENCQIIL